MSLATDAVVLENMETAVIIKNDETTINKLDRINRELEQVAAEPANGFHKKLVKTNIAFNKMLINRLKTGKYK